jgi:hypothetical protein
MGMLVLPCNSHIHGAVLGLEDNTGPRPLNSMLSMTMYEVSETMGFIVCIAALTRSQTNSSL